MYTSFVLCGIFIFGQEKPLNYSQKPKPVTLSSSTA